MNNWEKQMEQWYNNNEKYKHQQKIWRQDDINQCISSATSKMSKIIRLKKNSTHTDNRYWKGLRKWNTWTLEELETRYQDLIAGFSVAYLETTEWYMGLTLRDNPDFLYPTYLWAKDYKKWIKSLMLVQILTLKDYPSENISVVDSSA